MYILLCGEPPFNGKTDEEIMKRVEKGVWEFKGDVWTSISDAAKNLIKKMLEYDPKKRITAEQAYNDVWIQQQSNKEDIDKPVAASILNNLRQFTVRKYSRICC
jgi:calcium-dependent protein kinase